MVNIQLISPLDISRFSALVGIENDDDEKADVTINIKELDDVLIKDVGNHIASSGKCA